MPCHFIVRPSETISTKYNYMTLKTRIAKLELVTIPPEEIITIAGMEMTTSTLRAILKNIDGKTRGLPNS